MDLELVRDLTPPLMEGRNTENKEDEEEREIQIGKEGEMEKGRGKRNPYSTLPYNLEVK